MSICTSPRELGAVRSAPTDDHRREVRVYAAFAIAAAVPLSLGLYRLALPSLWFDESVSWIGAAGNWRDWWQVAVVGNDCGGFVYTLLLKFWVALFGTDEFVLRLPSVLSAAAAACVLLQIGRRTGSLRLGLCMAICLSLHPEMICWSRQARGYALEVCLTALYLWILLEYARSGGRGRAAALAIVGTLLSLTHIFGVFVVVGAALFLLLLRVDRGSDGRSEPIRRSLWPMFVACAAVGAWSYLMQQRIQANLNDFWIYGSIGRGYLGLALMLLPCLPITALCLIAGAGRLASQRDVAEKRRLSSALGCTSLVIFVGPLVASLLTRGAHHFILARYFLPGLVPIAIVLGCFFATFSRTITLPIAALVVAVGLVPAGVFNNYLETGNDLTCTRIAAATVNDRRRSDDQIVVVPDYHESILNYYGLRDEAVRGIASMPDAASQAESLRNEIASTTTRKWFFIYRRPSREELQQMGLASYPHQRFGNLWVVLYDPSAPQQPAEQAPSPDDAS